MTTSIIDADSLLAIDIGSSSTRCLLFDVVDGRYRFLASGEAPTTAGAPYYNVGEGTRRAMNDLSEKTGRRLIGSGENIIMPSLPDSSGVDTVVATMSAGEPLKIVAAGLLEDISLTSAQKLAHSTYANVVSRIGINDHRQTSERINAIIRTRPDLVIVTGGTNKGSSRAVLNLIEAVGLASYLSPEAHKPYILYAGNEQIRKSVQAELEGITNLNFAPNVRPTLNIEDLSPAQQQLARIYKEIRKLQMGGIGELINWSGGTLLPTATAFSRMIRFLSQKYDPDKGVLGVDVGSRSTTVTAAFNGESVLRVNPSRGVGEGSRGILRKSSLEQITRWLPYDISEERVRDYVFHKEVYPRSLPVTKEMIALEQALAREALRISMREIAPEYPPDVKRAAENILPWMEPIIATGDVISRAPYLGQALLMLLDGLQPGGITTVALDQNNITAALGAAAKVNPLLAVQVIETSTFLNLGTIIAPIGVARYGTPILRVRMTSSSGAETTREVRFGTIEVLPVNRGERVKLHLRPLHQFDVGMGGPGKAGEVQAVGGALRVVIDARGRPLQLSHDPARRRKLAQRWLQALIK
jgi:hypothetical protein